MGNTNSMNNMSMLDQKRYQAEFLRYSQIPYENQYLPPQQQSLHASNMNLHQLKQYKDQHPLSNPVKVLPDVKFEPKLRTTNNGAILSSGGTISGRKDSECGLHRSKSISETQNTYLSNPNGMPAPPPQFRMQRASTQLSINLQNPSRSNLNKNFGSSHDLKNSSDGRSNNNTNSNNNNNFERRPMMEKNHHHRDIVKKSRAPPPPLSNANNSGSSNSSSNTNNKIKMTPPPTMQAPDPPTPNKIKSKAPMAQRMFGDTLTKGKHLQMTKANNIIKAKIESDIAIKPKEISKSLVTKVIPSPAPTKPAPIIPKVNPVSYLRRERTFDMTLVQTENREKFRPKFSPQFQRKSLEVSLRPAENRQMTTQERYRASVGSKVTQNGFHAELQSATKLRRSTGVSANDKSKILDKKPLKKMMTAPLPNDPSPPPPTLPQVKLIKQPLEKKKSDNSAISNPTLSANSSFKFSKTISKEPEIIQFHRHGEEIELPSPRDRDRERERERERERIPSPKEDVQGNMNNFYFGMNEASVDTDDDDDDDDDDCVNNAERDHEAAQMDAINKFAENIFKMSSGGSNYIPQSQESVISDRDFDSDSSDILLNLRPTLPRRQLQIPRFSPVAAWKSLANETNMLDSRNNKISSSLLQLQEEAAKHETKIERIYREPSFNLHHLDNKSGDSGISADKDGGNSPDSQMPQAYLMSSWTPQQDLEEDEEESVDGDDKDSFHHHALDNDKSQSYSIPTNGHMFSLSLPRDNISDNLPQNNFYTLQKFRKSVADVFATNNGNPNNNINDGKIQIQNYAGDSNWLLSSQPNSIDDYSQRKDGNNQIISHMSKGKHVMYLPTNFEDANHRYESTVNVISNNEDYEDSPKYKYLKEKEQQSKSKSKSKFKFQSTIRQVERRKIAEKLSREAEEKEMHRLGEFEAMQKVEEEFQKKRAREKSLIKQQLRIASMEDNDFEPQHYFNHISNGKNSNHFNDNIDDEIDTRTPYISRIIEAKSPRVTISQYKSS